MQFYANLASNLCCTVKYNLNYVNRNVVADRYSCIQQVSTYC